MVTKRKSTRIVGRKSRKSRKPTTIGNRWLEQEQYSVTVFDAVRAIMADPDLDPQQKASAVKHMDSLDGNELTDFLNETYAKGYGADVNTQTPLAKFIEDIVERRNKRKDR